MTDVDELETLADYQSDEDKPTADEPSSPQAPSSADVHVGVHSSGFRELLLRPELLRAISDCGFEHPSQVQQECIPQAILGTDVVCQAKSGMGKTAVFVLSVLHQLDVDESAPHPGVLCLVLCHTRELAFQIRNEFERFTKYLPHLNTAVFFGGIPVAKDKKVLSEKPPHIAIGTPGRTLHLVQEKLLVLDNLKVFVLDEADSMLESLKMRRDVQMIFRETPHEKQVMMFSATLSDAIRPVCQKFMHNPFEVYINEGKKLTLHGLQQFYVQLEEEEKTRKLVDLLDQLEFNQLIIFVRSVSRCKALNTLLVEKCSFPSIAMYGGLEQTQRIALYKKFKDFQARIMVATNLLGRGIDIERVNVVINYDMPADADTYLHRVGRAGRFGTKGLAISFVSSDDDKEVLNQVQKRFVVDVPNMPDKIDASTYMGS